MIMHSMMEHVQARTLNWAFLPPAGIVLTNDGHAILREIDVTHPAAKVKCPAALCALWHALILCATFVRSP
jgi:hypothetical protein